jgi:hypothetical protein
VGVTHVVSCVLVWGRIPLCGICRWIFECVDLNVRCGRWTSRAAAAVGARVWRVASVGARAGAGVSVCLFVTICHCSKYAFIVVRCLRLEGVSLLHTALLRFLRNRVRTIRPSHLSVLLRTVIIFITLFRLVIIPRIFHRGPHYCSM